MCGKKKINNELLSLQGHYLQAVTMEQLGKFKESISSFLKALELDPESQHANLLVNNIATLATHFCRVPEKLLTILEGMLKMCLSNIDTCILIK